MRLVKTLIAFMVFWGVILAGIFAEIARWLVKQVFRSALRFTIVFLAAGALLVFLGLSFASSKSSERVPTQPMAFPHTVHAGKLALDCSFCHRTAEGQSVAGIPSLEQCMFCHQVAGKDKPEVVKLLKAYETGTALNWLRINRLPDTAHFDHSAHIRARAAKLTCFTCHGPVEQMETVTPVRSLKMGDCLGCHRSLGAPTTCAACHY